VDRDVRQREVVVQRDELAHPREGRARRQAGACSKLMAGTRLRGRTRARCSLAGTSHTSTLY
jgi:hypothetical protein